MKKIILVGNPGSAVVREFMSTHPEVVLMATTEAKTTTCDPKSKITGLFIERDVIEHPKPTSKFHK